MEIENNSGGSAVGNNSAEIYIYIYASCVLARIDFVDNRYKVAGNFVYALNSQRSIVSFLLI